jgi:hypothetical protein
MSSIYDILHTPNSRFIILLSIIFVAEYWLGRTGTNVVKHGLIVEKPDKGCSPACLPACLFRKLMILTVACEEEGVMCGQPWSSLVFVRLGSVFKTAALSMFS